MAEASDMVAVQASVLPVYTVFPEQVMGLMVGAGAVVTWNVEVTVVPAAFEYTKR